MDWLDLLAVQVTLKSLGTSYGLGKESTCNKGDLSLILGLGRSTEEEIGYPLQYSWASLVAQTVKNLPAMLEMQVQSLGWEDPLEKEMATHSSILAWEIPWTVARQGSLSLKFSRPEYWSG